MAIHDYNLANAPGATFRSDLNNALSAIVGLNNNATAPTTTFAYMLWIDTTAGVLKLRNAADSAWITVPWAIANSNQVDINGGAIDGTAIGAAVRAALNCSTLDANGNVNLDGGTFVFNEAGADKDFRCETDAQTHAFFLDALLNAVGFRKSAPDANHIHVGAMGTLRDIKTLGDGANITADMDTGDLFTVTLGGNRTLANPSNLIAGQSGTIFIIQDGTGSRTLAYGSYWDFAAGTAPTLTTAANAVDRIDYIARSTTSIHAVLSADVK